MSVQKEALKRPIIAEIELDLIVKPENDYRWKREYDNRFKTLKDSIRKFSQSAPIKVWLREDGLYEVVDGWYVVDALKELGEKRVVAMVYRDKNMAEIHTWAEDLHRKRRNALDLAKWAIQKISELKITQKALAEMIGLHPEYLGRVIRFYKNAPEDLKERYAKGEISFRKAEQEMRKRRGEEEAISSVEDEEEKEPWFQTRVCKRCGVEFHPYLQQDYCRACVDEVMANEVKEKLLADQSDYEINEQQEFEIREGLEEDDYYA
mgnify:CR=1 FL=1